MSLVKSLIRSAALFVCVVDVGSLFSMSKSDSNIESVSNHEIKNIIVMIPDGLDWSTITLSRWIKGSGLTLDSLLTGAVRTSMANSIITGSAAAATALSTGYKTSSRSLGLSPRSDFLLSTYKWPKDSSDFISRPLATVLEAAKFKGMATGLVATSRVSHATPAGFAVHIPDRGMDNEITEQLVYQNIDVVLGGGYRHLVPKSDGGKRKDGENLEEILKQRGYSFVKTRKELSEINASKIWGVFAKNHMNADVDRGVLSPEEPSLEEMTDKALKVLSKNKNGFFVMIEGSQVDWGGHANDAFWSVSDFLAFDKAVAVAKKFADENPETVIVALTDHSTGGMTIGHNGIKKKYTNIPVEDLVYPLKGMTLTSQGMEKLLGKNVSDESLKSLVKKYWKIDLTEMEVAEIIKRAQIMGYKNALNTVVAENYTAVGWTTFGHVGKDVPLWSYGAKKLSGNIDNTEVAHYVADLLNIDLDSLTNKLYVNLKTITNEYSIDSTDVNNPVVIACKEKKCLKIPVDKNIVEVSDGNKKEVIELPSVTVWIKSTGSVYLSDEVKKLLL